MEQQQIFPNDSGLLPTDLIMKATNVATVIQCGGLWFASGKFGVTWRLIQAVVKPKESLQGKCLISLSTQEKEVLRNTVTTEVDDVEVDLNDDNLHKSKVEDSDDDDDDDPFEPPAKVKDQIVKEVTAEVSDGAPKKKSVVRRKKTAE